MPTLNSETSTPKFALIYVGTDAVRFRADGTAPTSSVGVYLAAGDYLDLTNPAGNFYGILSKIKFIRVTTDATLDIDYFA